MLTDKFLFLWIMAHLKENPPHLPCYACQKEPVPAPGPAGDLEALRNCLYFVIGGSLLFVCFIALAHADSFCKE